MKKIFKSQIGFTLIELLIVVSLVGILGGVSTSVIDSKKQKARAEDAVSRNKVHKLASSIESYWYTEGNYPTSIDFSSGSVLGSYIKSWPVGFIYSYDTTTNEFSVQVEKAVGDGFLKYSSVWESVVECGPATDSSDPSDCDGSELECSSYDCNQGCINAGEDRGSCENGVCVCYAAVTTTSLSVSPASANLSQGSSVSLSAVAHYSDSSSANVTTKSSWRVQNPGVATVNQLGLVTGLRPGFVTISATYERFSDTSGITVESVVIPPASCEIDSDCFKTFCKTGLCPRCNLLSEECYCSDSCETTCKVDADCFGVVECTGRQCPKCSVFKGCYCSNFCGGVER